MRKNYLDHIRWITIILVVIFHIYFYYNNIDLDTKAMFAGAPAYDGTKTFAGLYQYLVYPWFMILLFVVAGISARIALKTKTNKEFMRARVDKVLVPSTLGILAFGWIGGYIIYISQAKVNSPEPIPKVVGVFITLFSGTGALWFCQVLFVAVLVLMLLRLCINRGRRNDDSACQWFEKILHSPIAFTLGMIILYLLYWGCSNILNMPVVTSYRMGIYTVAFLSGFYIFTNDSLIDKLKKAVPVTFLLAVASGIFYIWRCYGKAYTKITVLERWDLNLYAFIMVLLILGAGARWANGSNRFTQYMCKCCFGIYVFHIPVLLVTNYLLSKVSLPLTAVYWIELISALVCSLILYEIIRRIPILRYWILGIRSKKRIKDKKTV